MLESLARFVSYRSISSERGDYTEGCRRGATFLRTLLQRSGAETKLLNTENNCNPIVLSRFSGRSRNSSSRKRILFYGHYDVVGATDGKDKWRTDPFRLEGINGFLYGRGVSDNKGPIIAAIYAAAELVAEQRLDADIIFLIEGEEECGSRGLEAAVRQHKRLIGDIDWILAANSYWIDDDVPCLTYGLRGVIHSTVSVESSFPDLHSGVDGSTLIDEPLQDLVAILSKLKGLHGRVQIPEFYKDVPGITKAERERYTAITDALILRNPSLKDADLLADSLIKRWQEPTLTVHRMKVSGPENAAIIPRLARAAVSIRLVPNQDVAKIRDQLVNFLQSEFRKLDTLNQITITINQQAEPWLGDPDNAIFQTLEEAIIDVWGLAKEQSVTLPRPQTSTASSLKNTKRKSLPPTSYTLTHGANHAVSVTESSAYENTNSTAPRTRTRRPLYIREGGSIGGIRFLEKEFNAPAAHLPCGQASDKAHLDNERLRLVNLYNSKEIFKRVFGNLP
jgi:di- and tripeptidase